MTMSKSSREELREIANMKSASGCPAIVNECLDALDSAEQEIERLQLQLAACGVAAMCNTQASKEEQHIERDNPYWSASYGDVCRAVDREMGLRAIVKEAFDLIDEGLIVRNIQDDHDTSKFLKTGARIVRFVTSMREALERTGEEGNDGN